MEEKVLAINLSGITYLPAEVNYMFRSGMIEVEDEIKIIQTDDNSALYDGDYSVRWTDTQGEDYHIGWIPKIHTISKYMNVAYKKRIM